MKQKLIFPVIKFANFKHNTKKLYQFKINLFSNLRLRRKLLLFHDLWWRKLFNLFLDNKQEKFVHKYRRHYKINISIIQSRIMSVRPSIEISVTTEPIGFYSSGNIPTGPVVVLGYFLVGVGHPKPRQKKKKSFPL